MLVSPALVIGLLLAKRHLIEALLLGIANAVAIALRLGVITPFDLLHLDRATFGATNILVEGMQRAVGVIIFKLLLVSLVGTLQATDALDRLDARRAKAGIVDAQCEEPDRNCCLNCRVAHYAQRVRKF